MLLLAITETPPYQLEQDFEIATSEYDYINTALKQDMPRFMQLATQFIDPLFHSFFYMQLNIFYILLEKTNSFGEEAKMDIANRPGSQIAEEYEARRGDIIAAVENLQIIKRIISVCQSSVPSYTTIECLADCLIAM